MKACLSLMERANWLVLGLLLAVIACQPVTTWEVGQEELILSRSDLLALSLYTFPDGFVGIRWDSNEERVHFWAANSGQTAHLVGTLDSPALYAVTPYVEIQEPKSQYDYASGGPVYTDPGSGLMLLFYHIERQPNGYVNFLSSAGLAYSTDGGQTFTDLGEYLLSNVSMSEAEAAEAVVAILSGSPIIMGEYFYSYYEDIPYLKGPVHLAVARAKGSDVVAAASIGELAPWHKYYAGAWEEPANIDGDRGGRFTPLVNFVSCPNASYNAYLGKVVVVDCSWLSPIVSDYVLREMTSSDGISFSTPRILAQESGHELFYPTIVPTESDLATNGDPQTTYETFWVYYTNSATGGWNRWYDANWVRRSVSPVQ
jgi:hypothetical protein